MSLEFLGYIYLFSRIFLSSLYNVSVKFLKLNINISAVDIAFYSSLFGIIFLCLIFFKRNEIFGKNNDEKFLIPTLFAAIFGGALYLIFYNMGLQSLSVGKVSIIYYTYPVFFYIIGSIIIDKDLKKAFDPKILFGIFICILGITAVCKARPGTVINNESKLGYFYVMSSATSMIIFSLITKKFKVDTYWFLMFGQIISLIFGLFGYLKNNNNSFSDFNIPKFSIPIMIIFCIFGVLANVLREFLRIKSVEYLPVSKISTWNYFSPISNCISGVLFLKERLNKYDYLAYFLVGIGNYIANSKKMKILKTLSYKNIINIVYFLFLSIFSTLKYSLSLIFIIYIDFIKRMFYTS